MEVLRRGAEAEIRSGQWMGRDVIVKSRVPKSYRHPDLDLALRASRTKNEARLIHEARGLGVPTPIIYDIDLREAEMTLQRIPGERVKDALEASSSQTIEWICQEIGRLTSLLHRGGMVHGDLTTSNMILSDGKIWLIDFSLGGKNAGVEEMGVDLHLLKEAFTSAHSQICDQFHIIIDSYLSNFDRGQEIVAKMREIEGRGRYT